MPEYKSSSPLARSLGLHLICLIYPQPFVVEAEDQGLLDMILSVCQTQESFHQSVFKPLTVSRTRTAEVVAACWLSVEPGKHIYFLTRQNDSH